MKGFLTSALLVGAGSVAALPDVSSQALQNDVTTEGLMANLRILDDIAIANGGNRAFGLPGFDASRDFVLGRLAKLSDTATHWTQDFQAQFHQVEKINFNVDGKDIKALGLKWSPSTSAEGITAQLVMAPEGKGGCDPSAFEGLDVEGKIVISERIYCHMQGTMAGRVRAASTAGAAAVLVYNNVDDEIRGGTLFNQDDEAFRPCASINRADGLALKARLDAGEVIDAHFQQTQVIDERTTQNTFAETKGGDPNNVIMLGAHLDSVQAGAGINDDGSGSTLLLEIFTALQKYNVKNKVRFAWWGAEENGLLGSKFYTSNLNASESEKILLYLNFDMVSRGFFGVFDGDGSVYGTRPPAGSEVLEKLFVDDLTSKGVNVTPAVFTGHTDYAGFAETLWKPIGGLHTGVGYAQDPCYHKACDNYDNANPTTLTINAKSVAHVLSILAMKGETMIPKSETLARREVRIGEMEEEGQKEIKWWGEVEGEKHHGSCEMDYLEE